MNDKRRHVDPERQKQVEQQIMLSYQTQPSQVKKKNILNKGVGDFYTHGDCSYFAGILSTKYKTMDIKITWIYIELILLLVSSLIQ